MSLHNNSGTSVPLFFSSSQFIQPYFLAVKRVADSRLDDIHEVNAEVCPDKWQFEQITYHKAYTHRAYEREHSINEEYLPGIATDPEDVIEAV